VTGGPPLRVWVDAQLPPVLARWLAREFGIEAVHVEELGLLRAADSPIFEAARAAGAVVVTKDADFVRLLEERGAPPRVVWVTCGNVSNVDLRRIVLAQWPQAVGLLAAGEVLVAAADDAPLMVLEGHARLTAYALAPDALPAELPALVGVSPDVARWGCY
jgi:predicted nuclease of predicted toxin-antitoxin system